MKTPLKVSQGKREKVEVTQLLQFQHRVKSVNVVFKLRVIMCEVRGQL